MYSSAAHQAASNGIGFNIGTTSTMNWFSKNWQNF